MCFARGDAVVLAGAGDWGVRVTTAGVISQCARDRSRLGRLILTDRGATAQPYLCDRLHCEIRSAVHRARERCS